MNKQRGYVEIELDKPRKLRYDMNALALIEEKLNVPLAQIGEVQIGVKQIRLLLWAGLIHEDETLTEKDVGAMVDLGNIDYVNEKIGEAMSLATKSKNVKDGTEKN